MIRRSDEDIVFDILRSSGFQLCGSKTSYLLSHPNNVVFFNANVYGSDGRKLWYGDIDLTLRSGPLFILARELGEIIYVTREQPFRWKEQTKESLEDAVDSKDNVCVRFDP